MTHTGAPLDLHPGEEDARCVGSHVCRHSGASPETRRGSPLEIVFERGPEKNNGEAITNLISCMCAESPAGICLPVGRGERDPSRVNTVADILAR